MNEITSRCMLCNGQTIELDEHSYKCVECGYLNIRGK